METSHVEIFSMMAARSGSAKTVWSGDIPRTADPEMIYLTFNRLHDCDSNRLEELNYQLPSLSAGDYFTLDGVTYKVENFGMTRISLETESVAA